jgi:protein Tex
LSSKRRRSFERWLNDFVAKEGGVDEKKVAAVIALLVEGNTIPFIARYRKEVTGNLDEIQIRAIDDKHNYIQELEKRRETILKSIEEQGKLTDELKKKILSCTEKTVLEDLYLPYKPKRRTRATVAREKGLEPLAERILAQSLDGDPAAEGEKFIDAEKEVTSADQALQYARDIVAEVVAENADVRALVRESYLNKGKLVSIVVKGQDDEHSKFKDYFDYDEPVASIPSHRFLAVSRGEREGVLRLSIQDDDEKLINRILNEVSHNPASPFSEQLEIAVEDAYKRLISKGVSTDVRVELKMRADAGAVEVFADNLESLLLAAPFGTKAVIGVDPGLRTGCKCAALDATGKFLGHMTFNLVKGDNALNQGKRELASFIRTHEPEAIAVGNGTGGRETEKFVRSVLKEEGLGHIIAVQVSESGASVYSASELAGREFPDLDLTVRGAISIARRLQDPLAELVKIEPKSIGVGQYQHDVYQGLLSRKLDDVVESCVNRVGAELNTSSAELLSHIAGIGPKLAQNIVTYRETNGAFRNLKELLKVQKLGPRAFEQAAGFLRIADGENPLDASAVHPERYNLVRRMASDMAVDLIELVGNATAADKIRITDYIDDTVGELTLRDIIAELKKPGRDPREDFEPPSFREDVQTMSDLEEGMTLSGVVTNVTAFGAFVDVGVHQDGLVHISELADRFIKDPSEVVKVGDKIKVRVIGVDLNRKRISLSAKSESGSGSDPGQSGGSRGGGRGPRQPQRPKPRKFTNNPFADLLKNR